MLFDLTTSALVSAVRFGAGSRVLAASRRPTRALELYEFEACPFCRKVREALSGLDLDVLVYPCPKRGQRYRPRVAQLGGKLQFPFLVDPNTERSLYESDAIIEYLSKTYALSEPEKQLLPRGIMVPSSALAALARPLRGMLARTSRVPERPLTLYGYESSPACRLVRERLCELELPYVLRNAARGSVKRSELLAQSAQVELPFLIDLNSGDQLSGARAILRHLEAKYAA